MHSVPARSANVWRVAAVALIMVPVLATLARRREGEMAGRPGIGQQVPMERQAGETPLRRAWFVMGTTAVAEIWEPDVGKASSAFEAVRATTLRVDSLMSTYLPGSEVSLVNRRAGSGKATPVSRETATVVARALQIGRASGGRLDITVGPLVDAWNFRVAWRGEEIAPPPAASIDSARVFVDQERVVIDPTGTTILLAAPGMRIDLGAIAKGFALDAAAAALENLGIERACLELGGQIRVLDLPAGAAPWRLGIRHPRRPDRIAAIVSIDGGSLATSGDYERFFVWKGRRYFHIIDPSTGWPAYGTVSVTVWAPSGMDADAWSTALFVAGPDRGMQMLAGYPELGAIWIVDPGDEPLAPRHFRIAGALDGRVDVMPAEKR